MAGACPGRSWLQLKFFVMICERYVHPNRWRPATALLIFLLSWAGAARGQYGISALVSPKADYMLLIDNSTSIEAEEEKKLMRQATRLFIDVLEEGDKLAIIGFSKDASVLFNREMRSMDTREAQADRVVSQLTFSVGQSNITAAFEKAAAIAPAFWRGRDKFGKEVPRIVILISDGRLYLKEKDKVPAAYRQLKALLQSGFQGVAIHTLEIKTKEASLDIPGLAINGSQLLQEMSAQTPNGFYPLQELVDVIENYVAIVKENKGTTTFTSLHTPVEVAEVVRELRIFILKRDRLLQPVSSEDIRISIDREDTLRYRKTYDRLHFSPLNDQLELRWNSKDEIDFITIRRRGQLVAPPDSLDEELPYAPSFSVELAPLEIADIPDRHVFVVMGKSWMHLEPRVPAAGSKYHPIMLGLNVWKEDFYKVPPSENKKLEKLEAWVDIGKAGQSKNNGRRFDLKLNPDSSTFYLDISQEVPGLEEGEYWVSFFAKSKSSRIPPRVDSIPFNLKTDYLKPLHPSPVSWSDWKARPVRVGVEIDRNAKRYQTYFDPAQPLIEVRAIIQRNGEEVANFPLEKTSGAAGQGPVSYTGEWTVRDTGGYRVCYEITGYRYSEENALDVGPDRTAFFPLATVYRSSWHAVVRWSKWAGVAALISFAVSFFAGRLRPTFLVSLFHESGDEAVVNPAKGQRRKRHSFRVKVGQDTFNLKFYGGRFKKDRYNAPVFFLRNGSRQVVVRKRRQGRLLGLSPYQILPVADGDEIIFQNGAKKATFSIELS